MKLREKKRKTREFDNDSERECFCEMILSFRHPKMIDDSCQFSLFSYAFFLTQMTITRKKKKRVKIKRNVKMQKRVREGRGIDFNRAGYEFLSGRKERGEYKYLFIRNPKKVKLPREQNSCSSHPNMHKQAKKKNLQCLVVLCYVRKKQ